MTLRELSISVAEEAFLERLTSNTTVDAEELLRDYYKKVIEPGYTANSPLLSAAEYAVPILLYKTHVTTLSGGVVKSISISDFRNIIVDLVGEASESIPPLGLPFGCFMIRRSGDMLQLSCYYGETEAEITFDNREVKKQKFKVPLPNIIISFTLKKIGENLWQTNMVKYFSTPKSVTQLPDDVFISDIDSKAGIFKLPFPNMYGDNRMCFGGNTMPIRFTNNLRGLDYYYQILTLAPFNVDLGVLGVKGFSSPVTWFAHLKGLKKFPYDLLT